MTECPCISLFTFYSEWITVDPFILLSFSPSTQSMKVKHLYGVTAPSCAQGRGCKGIRAFVTHPEDKPHALTLKGGNKSNYPQGGQGARLSWPWSLLWSSFRGKLGHFYFWLTVGRNCPSFGCTETFHLRFIGQQGFVFCKRQNILHDAQCPMTGPEFYIRPLA